MLDFTNVSREIRSVTARRRELLTFLGSVFAAMGLFLQNLLHESLPPPYDRIRQHGFAYYALLLLVPSALLALRLARLNSGLTLNGILFQRLMQEQDFAPRATSATLRRAGRLNVFGVGFLMSFLSDLIAGFSATLLAVALRVPPFAAALIGAGTAGVGVLAYLYFHDRAVRFALLKSATDVPTPFTRDQWEDHVARTREDGNHDMITILALVGLITFSAFEGLGSLGKAGVRGLDIVDSDVQSYGPIVYGLLMAVTCLFGMVTYLRLRIAIGRRSLELDPTDRPFRPFRLTDSLLGYMLLGFLFVLSVHFLLYEALHEQQGLLLGIDAGVFVTAVVIEQVTVVLAGRGVAKR